MTPEILKSNTISRTIFSLKGGFIENVTKVAKLKKKKKNYG